MNAETKRLCKFNRHLWKRIARTIKTCNPLLRDRITARQYAQIAEMGKRNKEGI